MFATIKCYKVCSQSDKIGDVLTRLSHVTGEVGGELVVQTVALTREVLLLFTVTCIILKSQSNTEYK